MVREPEFDSRERSLILARLAAKADMGPYGIPLSRATDPDAVFKASERPTMNKAVMAAHRVQERYFKQYKDAKDYESALLWSVTEVTAD